MTSTQKVQDVLEASYWETRVRRRRVSQAVPPSSPGLLPAPRRKRSRRSGTGSQRSGPEPRGSQTPPPRAPRQVREGQASLPLGAGVSVFLQTHFLISIHTGGGGASPDATAFCFSQSPGQSQAGGGTECWCSRLSDSRGSLSALFTERWELPGGRRLQDRQSPREAPALFPLLLLCLPFRCLTDAALLTNTGDPATKCM